MEHEVHTDIEQYNPEGTALFRSIVRLVILENHADLDQEQRTYHMYIGINMYILI